MNKRPVSYLQTDPRWAKLRYPCNGGTMSVGGGGCGPTSAAMLIETLTGKTFLPTDAMLWACQNGFVTANQGTDYSYFYRQFQEHGIDCGILTWASCLSATSPARAMVEKKLREGYYFIALMKKGLWTSGGHYVVVWWADDRIRINDPASTRFERLNGDPDVFFSQAKYFWWVDARKHNKETEEEDMERFNTMEEIENGAAYAAPTVEKLLKKDILRGRETGLDLSRDMLRLLVMNDRAGVYDR